jgi:hypothetical protein
MAFTSHGDSAIDVCIENILSDGTNLSLQNNSKNCRPCTGGIQDCGIGR